ncbi:MAG TPA: TonB family protein [Vicinamibacteria bacterium]|nr:TonB family protein [Vicinamibacteria bacterium]
MATMSGSLPPTAPGRRSAVPRDDQPLFANLVLSTANPVRRRTLALPFSIAAHVVVIALVVLVPIFWPDPPPEQPDYIRALIYNPPPPPPPPLPKGAALVEKPDQVSTPVTEKPEPTEKTLTAQIESPKVVPEDRSPAEEQVGSENGSDFGVAEGMEEGVEGGVVGGVPGGVLGGVVGGTGDGPVMDYDQPPRPIKMTRPQYPQEAFVKKIEGTVDLEILIDSTGRVVKARVVRSIPLLDAAAIQTVTQWVFSPAIKNGRPVATIATAPVTFRIF